MLFQSIRLLVMPSSLRKATSFKSPKISIFLVLTVLVVHSLFITYGSAVFLAGERYGRTYDSLGENLLWGETHVDPNAIKEEGFYINGKTYTYFGPLPALLRIIPNALFPGYYGKWSRLSCLSASLLGFLAFLLILSFSLSENKKLEHSQKKFIYLWSGLGFGLGSPLIYLMSCGWIFHEASLWGFGCSLWSIYFLLRMLYKQKFSYLESFGFSFFAGLAFLSRAPFGIPFVVIIAFISVLVLLKGWCQHRLQTIAQKLLQNMETKSCRPIGLFACIALPAFVCVCFYLWYNYSRFGSIFLSAPYQYYIQYLVKEREFQGVIEAGFWNVRRIPIAIANYFGIEPIYFASYAPFIHGARILYLSKDLYVTSYSEWVVSLFYSALWLMPGGLAGIVVLIKNAKDQILSAVIGLAFLTQYFLIFAFYFITQRYTLDLFPLLVFAYALVLGKWELTPPLRKRLGLLKIGFMLSCVFAIVVNICSTLSITAFANWGVPNEVRASLREKLSSFDQVVLGQNPAPPKTR